MPKRNPKQLRASRESVHQYITTLDSWGKSFIVIKNGGSITVSIPRWKKRKKFFVSSPMHGGYLCGLLRRQLAGRIKQKKYRIKKYPADFKPVTQIHLLEHINGAHGEFVCIDITACYWRTAWLLGIIDDVLYERGISDEKFKVSRNAAIGSLGKTATHEAHRKGEIDRDASFSKRDKYYNVRIHVLEYVHEVADEIIEACGKDFYFFLTDAFYINKSKFKIVSRILSESGFEFTVRYVERMKLQSRTKNHNSGRLSWKLKGEKKMKHLFISAAKRSD